MVKTYKKYHLQFRLNLKNFNFATINAPPHLRCTIFTFIK